MAQNYLTANHMDDYEGSIRHKAHLRCYIGKSTGS